MSRAVKVIFDTPYCGTDETSYYIFGDAENDFSFMKQTVEEDFDSYRENYEYLVSDDYYNDPDYENSSRIFHDSVEYEDYLDSCSYSMVPIAIKNIPENADIKNLEEMFG